MMVISMVISKHGTVIQGLVQGLEEMESRD